MKPSHASTIRGLRDDAGFILVEVMVSAALLILVSLSVFTALDQGDKLAGQQARRAMAANMAQAEIERIRSLPIEDVARLSGSREIVDPGTPKIKFTVTATSRWVTDGGDEPVCTTRSGGLDYMRLNAKVEWTGMGKAKPVTFSTVITPASRASSKTNGSLSVNVAKADGVTGVSGLSITIVSPGGSFSEVTNTSGCVVFPFVPAGPYQLRFNRTGWVNQNSVGAVDDGVNVAAGQTTKLEYLYDLGGTTDVRFKVRKYNANGSGDEVPSEPNSIALYNGDMTPGPMVEAMSGSVEPDHWVSKPLFPSQSPYTLYAGACNDNNPGSAASNVNIAPGLFQRASPVRVPSYDVRVLDGTSGASATIAINNAQVVVYAGCGASYERRTVATNPTATNDPTQGRLSDPGFPYATTATLCVFGMAGDGRNYRYSKAISITNIADNPPLQPVYIQSTSGSTSVRTNTPCTV